MNNTNEARRAIEKERLERAVCVNIIGSATGPAVECYWLPPGRHYCEGKLLRARYWPLNHQCQECGSIYPPPSFAARGATQPSLAGIPRAHECYLCHWVTMVSLRDDFWVCKECEKKHERRAR